MAYLSREARREQIVNAVVDLVSQEGLAAATVRRIAQDLGCSPGQIHHHFASADALRAEAVREVWRRLEPDLVALLRRHAPRERIATILSGCVADIDPALNPLLVVAHHLWQEAWDSRKTPAIRDAFTEGIANMQRKIMMALQELVETGALAAGSDLDEMSLALIAASQGYDFLAETIGVNHLGAEKASYADKLLSRFGLPASADDISRPD